jgi:lipopolysaccharide export system permease protein
VAGGGAMSRLGAYLMRLLTRESVALLAIMLGLLFLMQCLKIFDVVVVQGQNLATLFGQAALAMPPLAIVIGYVCMGIGVVRALGALQASQELHVIHTNRQVRALFGGIARFAVVGAVLVLVVSNFVEPWANRRLSDWSAAVAADLVGRTLRPHRISQVVPGVTIVIAGRQGNGNIVGYFSDDARDPKMRRTYSAATAKLARSPAGYVLELHDGSLQYLSNTGDFSQIAFKTYNIGLDKLTQPQGERDQRAERTTPELVSAALAAGHWDEATLKRLFTRLAEGLRAVAMCTFMAALAAFPSGRRRRAWFPLELVPLLVAYADKSITENVPLPVGIGQFAGPGTVLVAGLVVLVFRLHPFATARAGARAA